MANVGRDPGKLRIALMITPFAGSPVDPEVAAATQAAAKLCESLGHHVEVAAPKIDVAATGQASFVLIASAIAADIEDRAKLLGITPGPDVLEPITLGFHGYGKTLSAMDAARSHNAL